MSNDLKQRRIDAAIAYFKRVDAGESILDLLTDDIQIFFPKYGTGVGKDAVMECAQGFMTALSSIEHDYERMSFFSDGDHLIVEGFEKGVTRDGTPWPDPARSEGRFCNVFQFDGTLIKRVHVYVDPDFTSAHQERFLWGDTIRRMAG